MDIDGLDHPRKAPPQPSKCKTTPEEAAVSACAILQEATHRMPQNSPIQRDLINILVTGFNDGKDGADTNHLEGLDTKDVMDLLGVSESAVSRARHDPENIMMKIKYAPDVTRNRSDPMQEQLLEVCFFFFTVVLSGSTVCSPFYHCVLTLYS